MNRSHGLLSVSMLAAALITGAAGAADGPKLYKENCQKCHGETGHADTWRGYLSLARNFTKAKWQASETDEEILKSINEGPRIMPAFEEKLTLEERKALVKVIRGFAEKP